MHVDMLFTLVSLSDLPQSNDSGDALCPYARDTSEGVPLCNFIYLCSHPINTSCDIPHGCRSLIRGHSILYRVLVECGLQVTTPCLHPGRESSMLGLAKIPAKISLAALRACKIATVYVVHYKVANGPLPVSMREPIWMEFCVVDLLAHRGGPCHCCEG